MSGPDFHDLFGDDLPEEEAARLQHVHDLLVEAGPPPELPPSLAEGPGRRAASPSVTGLPRRRVGATLLIAAAIAVLAFGGGYLLGHRSNELTTAETVPMHATNGNGAQASLQIADAEAAGNSPITMVVHGLPDLGKKGYYELVLTRKGEQLASCGTFVVGGESTTVRLNAPYLVDPDADPGWVVVSHVRGTNGKPPVLLTT